MENLPQESKKKSSKFFFTFIIMLLAYFLGVVTMVNVLVAKNLENMNLKLVITLKDGLNIIVLNSEQKNGNDTLPENMVDEDEIEEVDEANEEVEEDSDMNDEDNLIDDLDNIQIIEN
jgi:phosphopantothenoylcysteine synthetase/decarboxylase